MTRKDKWGGNNSGVNEVTLKTLATHLLPVRLFAAVVHLSQSVQFACPDGKPNIRKVDTAFVFRILGWIKKREKVEGQL